MNSTPISCQKFISFENSPMQHVTPHQVKKNSFWSLLLEVYRSKLKTNVGLVPKCLPLDIFSLSPVLAFNHWILKFVCGRIKTMNCSIKNDIFVSWSFLFTVDDCFSISTKTTEGFCFSISTCTHNVSSSFGALFWRRLKLRKK